MSEEFVEPYPGYLEESRAAIPIAVTALVVGLAFTAVATRIYTRAFLLKQMGPDDWASICAFLLVFGCGFAVAYNVQYGLGRHVAALSVDDISNYLRTFYVSIVMYNASLVGIKATFLLQYYRVLAVSRLWKRIYAAMLFVIGGWSLSQVFVQIFICTPIHKFWDVLGTVEGTCIPNIPQWYINAGGNIATDIAVLVLPLPAILALKLKRGSKLVLVGIFCLGFFTVAVSMIRIKFLKLGDDDTWDNVESACWSISELCSGLICACLPTLRPLVARYVPALGSRSGRAAGSKGGYYIQTNDERHLDGSTSNGRSLNASRVRKGDDMELGEGGYYSPGRDSPFVPSHGHLVAPHHNRHGARPESDVDVFGPPGTVLGEKQIHHVKSSELSEADSMNSEDHGRKSSSADEERAIIGRRTARVGVTTDIGVARPERAALPTGRGIRIERDVVQVTTERM